ncbi:MAG TPA: hypothetical protein VEC35_23415 [Noviherbaspirillum sp.]|nr:hypothetical protein [Noviherbaspirillum sp.]
MQQFIQAMGAGSTWTLQTGGEYFRLVTCPDPVDVKFYRGQVEVASATQMDTGFYLKPAGGFDRVDITSATAQTVKIMVIDGDGGYDHFNVDISGTATMTTKQAATVNDVAAVAVGLAATQLVAASATRRGLRFFNAGTADVYLGGAGVTVAGGAIKISAGQTWIESEAAPAAWYGISGTAAQSIRIQELTA